MNLFQFALLDLTLISIKKQVKILSWCTFEGLKIRIWSSLKTSPLFFHSQPLIPLLKYFPQAKFSLLFCLSARKTAREKCPCNKTESDIDIPHFYCFLHYSYCWWYYYYMRWKYSAYLYMYIWALYAVFIYKRCTSSRKVRAWSRR